MAAGKRANLGPVEIASQPWLPNANQLPLPPVFLGKDDQLLLCKVQSKSSFCAVQVVVSQKGVALFCRLHLDWEEMFRFDAVAPEG